jgi:hypothetical protein
MNYKYKAVRPKRELLGMSPSEFKTLLKRRGYKVPRRFFKYGLARKGGRIYRFRWWSAEGFLVDKGCVYKDFDRWANSVDKVIPYNSWLEGQQ